MATQGRKSEKKAWDTGFRHVFSTSYLKDPDLHIFMFISEAEVNQIMRDALRDYMVKHSSRALDPEFQAGVFMEASRQVSRGVRPVGSEVMIVLGEPVETSARAKARVPVAQPRQAQAPERTPALAAPVPIAAAEPPVTAKPKVVLDFGPELVIETGEPAAEAKPSQREKWLRNNKHYASENSDA